MKVIITCIKDVELDNQRIVFYKGKDYEASLGDDIFKDRLYAIDEDNEQHEVASKFPVHRDNWFSEHFVVKGVIK